MPKISLCVVFFCLVLGACTLGSEGVLGQGGFMYHCVGHSDPYCDGDPVHPPCVGFCPDPDYEMPEAIAVGARFQVSCDLGLDETDDVISASPPMLASTPTGFEARQPGEVAVLARKAGYVEDYYYVRLVVPERVRVDRYDDDGLADDNIDHLEVDRGTSFWLRATTTDLFGRILYGALPCSWSVTDGSVATIESFPSDNLVEVTADASGMATIQVTLGELSADVELTVVDASGM